jgi:hypothetical protein
MLPRYFLVILLIAGWAAFAQAGGTVELQLVGDSSLAAAFQEWGKALDKGGIYGVRIRSGDAGEAQPKIETAGSYDRPVYHVTGVVVSRDELLTPGGRFKRSEIGRLKEWIDDLGQNGLPSERPAKVAFGLTAKQYEDIRKRLSKPQAFAAKGTARNEAVEKIAKQLELPLTFADASLKELGDGKIEDEMTALGSGTALAALIRPAGYGMTPKFAGGKWELSLAKVPPDSKDVWPVGEPPEKMSTELFPELMDFHSVNVQNVSAATAADAIAKRSKAPLLYDRLGLAKYKIDPEKKMVTLPQSRTTYSLALRKLLFQAGLKFEIRVDEAGTPFLWVAAIKPL